MNLHRTIQAILAFSLLYASSSCSDDKPKPDMSMSFDLKGYDLTGIDLTAADLTSPPCTGCKDPQHCVFGQCVECIVSATESDCGPGLGCTDNKCIVCKDHSSCASQVCDLYQPKEAMGKKGGTCLRASDVIYVDNDNTRCGDDPKPACTITAGIGRVTDAKKAVRVIASGKSYGPITIAGGKPMVLYGAAGVGGKAQLGNDPRKNGVTLSGGANVTLDGFEISSSAIGIRSDGATMTLRRSVVTGNKGGALALVSTTYSVTNNFIIANNADDTPAVSISSDSSGKFQFNTVARNTNKIGLGGIDCQAGVTKPIEDSIVVLNDLVGTSQFNGKCMLSNVVVGTGDTTPGGNPVDPVFVKPMAPNFDFHLKAGDVANTTCCVDKASMNMSVPVDYDGTIRPQGAGWDIGAHELQ